jgi:uncharacterized protein (DUF305 family)
VNGEADRDERPGAYADDGDDGSRRAREHGPFDKAFIDAMISHHRSAIEMAQVAYRESDNPEIKALAEGIVEAQTREIEQMKGWSIYHIVDPREAVLLLSWS